jgi:HNH endonuclease
MTRKGDVMPLHKRLWDKFLVEPDGCWQWTGSGTAHGYGVFFRGPGPTNGTSAHRVVYEWVRGPIPDGMHLDHQCRNRGCVNPDHMEPVTPRENWLRSTTRSAVTYNTGVCVRGHDLTDPTNVRVTKSGGRVCRACQRIHTTHRRARTKEK